VGTMRPSDTSRDDRRIPLSRHRRALAASMTQSARIPQFGLFRDVDVSQLREIRNSVELEERFSYSDAITAACARALRSHPAVNASFDEEANCIVEHASVNVGLAVSAPMGLIVVVVRDADHQTLPELARERDRLTLAATAGTLVGPDVFGATFVISNLGPAGIQMFQALLMPPLAAILAVGAVRDAPASVVPAASEPLMTVCLTLDHRVLDGMAGAMFLDDVVRSLEDPNPLLSLASVRSGDAASWT
jgi:pyruvate dehydrogenase E2 component (dihydrolipoamide acetyltransferase)